MVAAFMKRTCCILLLPTLAASLDAQVLTGDPSERRMIPVKLAADSHVAERWMRSIPANSNLTVQMRALGVDLHKFIVPPIGTPRQEVEAVFDTAFNEGWVTHEDGSRPGTIANYELLPRNIDKREGVVLRVFFRGGTQVGHDVELQHWCARSGKVDWFPGEAEEETRKVLIDLLQIYGKYREKLERANWNAHKRAEKESPTRQSTRTKE